VLPRWRFSTLRGGKTLRETIENHGNNNYNLVRLILSASVIYFHSFGMSPGYLDHLSIALRPVTDVGGLAVQMFFFLSGLFVAQSFHKDPRVPSFLLKRFLRIWPGLFICLLVTATVIAAVTGHSLWRYLTFSGFYDYVLRNSVFDLTWNIEGLLANNSLHSLNGSIHTLPMEAKMYGVLAVMGAVGLMCTPRRIAIGGAVTFMLALIPGVVERLPFNLFDADYSRTAGALFLAGATMYGLSSWVRPALWQGAILIPAAMATFGIEHKVLFYASAVWVMLMIGQSTWIASLWRPKQDLSYGIYIYGWPSQQICMALAPIHLTPDVLSLTALALASGFAAISWRFVERPTIKFGKEFTEKPAMEALKKYRYVLGTLGIVTAICIGARWVTLRWDFVPVVAMQARIADFGPHDSHVGAPINRQSDGSSALWIRTEGRAPEGTSVLMAGRRLPSQVGANLITAKVDARILATPGEKPISLEWRSVDKIERSNVVELRITP